MKLTRTLALLAGFALISACSILPKSEPVGCLSIAIGAEQRCGQSAHAAALVVASDQTPGQRSVEQPEHRRRFPRAT